MKVLAMRDSFSGFYGVSDDVIGNVFTSANTIFIFDANILLTLYRCEEETRNRFFEIWVSIKEQCWFPHQVCLEYQRNRLKVVKDSRDALDNIPKKINSSFSDLRKQIFDGEHSQTISRYSNLKGELTILFAKIDQVVNSFSENHIEARMNNINFLTRHDVIRDKIDDLTAGRIGPAPESQKVIDELNASGKNRYKYKIGPGYDDSANKKNQFYSFDGINYDGEYGDYYVWSQILEHVKGKTNCNVIYVTNDAKSDFYYKIENKIRGPNQSLSTEIKSHGVAEFLLQNIDTFLHHANSHLDAKIDETVITELSNASETKNILANSFEKFFRINLWKQHIISNPNALSNLMPSELQELFSSLQNELNNIKEDLLEVNSISGDELTAIQAEELHMFKERLNRKLSTAMTAMQLLGKKLGEKEEAESINTLIRINQTPGTKPPAND